MSIYRHKMSPRNKRPSIAFLSENDTYESEMTLFQGAAEAAERCDVNMLYFSHLDDDLDGTRTFDNEQQAIERLNRKYDNLEKLIDRFAIDGLLITGWSSDFAGDKIQALKDRFKNIPIMSLGKEFEQIPSVVMHGGPYVKQLTMHLIQDHSRRNIVYLPPWNEDERFDYYIEAMQESGIYDEKLVVRIEDIGGITNTKEKLETFLSIVLDERQVPVDAILTPDAAEGPIVRDLLAERGLRIPEDIALGCFEEQPTVSYSKPPLTTIAYPFKEVGYHGCLRLAQLIGSGEIPLTYEVPTRIIFRDSCGCTFGKVRRMEQDSIEESAALDYDKEIAEVIGVKMLRHFPNLPLPYRAIAESFLRDIREGSTGHFLTVFQKYLAGVADETDSPAVQDMIDRFRALLMPYVRNRQGDYDRSEELWFAARNIAKGLNDEAMVTRYMEGHQASRTLGRISREMLTPFSIPKIVDVLQNLLGLLQIHTSYIFMYNTTEKSFDDCRLVFGYHEDQNKTSEFATESRLDSVFQTYERMKNRRYTLIVMLLHVNEEQIGLKWIEPGPNRIGLMSTLGVQLSAALKGAMLLEESRSLVDKLSAEIILRQQKEALLAYYADTDALTGLYNRRFCYTTLHAAVENKQPFSVFYIDIDGFKQVNDTYGHDAGDALLVQIVGRINEALQDIVCTLNHSGGYEHMNTHTIFRLGGDEFIAFMNTVSVDTNKQYARQLLESIHVPYEILGHKVSVSCSIGISMYPGDTHDADTLLKYADIAMYEAKVLKDTFKFYQDRDQYNILRDTGAFI